MKFVRNSVSTFVATIAMLIVLPAAAQAGFSSNLIDISGTSGQIQYADSAVGPDGEAVVAWLQPTGVGTSEDLHLRRIEPDGTVGPVLTVPDGPVNLSGAKVAFDSNSRVIVAYTGSTNALDSSFLKAVWMSAAGVFETPVSVASAATGSVAADPAVIVSSTNDAVVAWHNMNSTPGPFRKVEIRRVFADNLLGLTQIPASAGGALNVRLSTDDTGGVTVAWKEGDNIKVQRLPGSDILGGQYTPVTAASNGPALASDGKTQAQLLYRKGTGPSSLEYRSITPEGLTFPEQNISPDGADLVGLFDIATNPSAVSLAAWARAGSPGTVSARFVGGDRVVQPDTYSSPDPADNQEAPSVGIDGAGEGHLAWLQTSPTAAESIWGRSVAFGGNTSEPVKLSNTEGGQTFPEVDVAANGFGLVAWAHNSTTQSTVVARQILPAPTCVDATATVVQGAPVAIDLECSGPQLLAPELVDRPEHGTVTDPTAVGAPVIYTPQLGYEGTDRFTFRGVNPGGSGAVNKVTITVGRDTTVRGTTGRDSVAPIITRFSIKPKKFRFNKKTVKRKKATLRLAYSEPSTAFIKIEKKKGKKFKKFSSLTASSLGTTAKVILKGKIRKRKFKPGIYRATATATDTAGNTSPVKRLKFKVRRPRR